MSSLRVALLGYGYAGKTFHAPLIQSCSALSLTHIGSRQGQVLQQAVGNQIRVEADILALMSHPHIDIVVIATPNASHFSLAEAALNAGKHVVVDKPFTLTFAEATRLCELAVHNNRLLSVFHNRRYDDDFITLQQHINGGTYGTVHTLTSRFDRYRPEVRQRWREQAVPGAGLWYDLGPHLLDQALLLFGEPLRLSGHIQIRRVGATVDDEFAITLHYAQHQVHLQASMLQASPTPRFELQGSAGHWQCLGLDPQEEQLKAGLTPLAPNWGVRPDAASESSAAVLSRGGYQQYYAQLAAAIHGEAANPVPAWQAARVMYWLELAKNQLLT